MEHVVGDLRVQLLSPTVVRLEVRGPQGFEDRPTFTVVERDWPGAPFELDGERIVTEGFTVEPAAGAVGTVVRVPGHPPYTVEAVQAAGWLPAPGETGPVHAIADSPRLVPPPGGALPANATGPLAATSGYDTGNDATDIYLFITDDPHQLRRDVLRLTGPVPLVPRYALGLWDSRYYPYTEELALETIDVYRERGIPLDVFVLDTDWRVGASKGYGVNLELLPDLGRFLREAHERQVRVMLNDHPEPQAETALDPLETKYRHDNLAELLELGVDVWWYDRNWSTVLHEPMPGLPKETWGAGVFQDVTAAAAPGRRPMVMANVDGIDHGKRVRPPHPAFHRFPVAWTGDTFATWDYLRMAVENGVDLGVLALVPYVHEDCGAHNLVPTPEQYVRWVQYCALSPVLRLHCTYGSSRFPWDFGKRAYQASTEAILFRYRLLPTLYSAVHAATRDGLPLLRRLDLEHPDLAEARDSTQYLLGDDLLVAPVLEAGAATRSVWVPPGTWIDLWTGDRVLGPTAYDVPVALRTLPLLVRDGGLLFLGATDVTSSDEQLTRPITVEAYPGPSTTRVLVEDDGVSVDAPTEERAVTCVREGDRVVLQVAGSPRPRDLVVRVHLREGDEVGEVTVDGAVVTADVQPPVGPADELGALFAARGGPVVELAIPGATEHLVTVALG